MHKEKNFILPVLMLLHMIPFVKSTGHREMNLEAMKILFFFLAVPTAYRSSWARDPTYATVVAMPGP